MATDYIKLDNLHKSFGPKAVLRGFSLSIPKGSSLVIIGGSGSGKSVLLKTILGLIKPDHGDVYLDGKGTCYTNARQREAINSRIGMLFQNAALFDSLKVWENVAFGLMEGSNHLHQPDNPKLSRTDAKDVAVERLAQVGLGPDIADLFPDELSGGMRKRVGLARAIACKPEIILFDEPTTGLDPIMGHMIDELISSLVKDLGVTAISITHDMASARRISDQIAMLYQGQCIWQGDTKTIDKTDNPYVKQFINGEVEGPIQMEVRRP